LPPFTSFFQKIPHFFTLYIHLLTTHPPTTFSIPHICHH
jgi:hypothetical protein